MRKSKTVTIEAEGRDRGKTFLIVEMPASQAEEWAMRYLEAVAKASSVPAGVAGTGMMGLFILGIKPLLAAPFSMTKPLLDEMFDSCLSIVPDPKRPDLLRGAGRPGTPAAGRLMEEDIEEVATRVRLRDAIVELHVGFSVAAFLSQCWERAWESASPQSVPTSRPDSP